MYLAINPRVTADKLFKMSKFKVPNKARHSLRLTRRFSKEIYVRKADSCILEYFIKFYVLTYLIYLVLL